MQETYDITEFDKFNKHEICRYIAHKMGRQEAEDVYYQFLGSMYRYGTLDKYDSKKASYRTYVCNCLRNFIHVHQVTPRSRAKLAQFVSLEEYTKPISREDLEISDSGPLRARDRHLAIHEDPLEEIRLKRALAELRRRVYKDTRATKRTHDKIKALFRARRQVFTYLLKSLTTAEIQEKLNCTSHFVYRARKDFLKLFKKILAEAQQ